MDESKSDEEVLRTRDDFEMMHRPHLWPNRASLCLKNPSLTEAGSDRAAFAVLLLRQGDYYFLPRHGAGFDESKVRRGGEELLRELIAAGWIVD